MMQTQIPRGLQALMQASQVLSSQASPTAPGPQGPQPTVAERVNQQIKQMSQPRPEPGGIMNLPPGLKDVGQQAGIAGQIMAQRQAQQQQMAQDPQAVAQMAAQMVRGQGVDQLPVNMGFKEGGIIGFQGQDRSDVPEASTPATVDEIRQRLVAAVKSGDMNAVRMYQQQLAAAQARQGSAAPEGVPPALNMPQNVIDPSELRSKMAEAVRNRDVAAAQGYARQLASLSGQGQVQPDDGRRVTIPPRLNQPVTATVVPTQEPAALEPMTSEPPLPTRADRLPSSPPVGIEQLLPGGARPTAQRPPTRPAAPTAPREPTPTAPAAAQPVTIDTSGIKPIDISKGIDQLAPDRTTEQINRQRALYEERERIKASMPDQFEAGITALEKDKTLRKELLKSKQERDNFNRMIAFFQDLRTKGNQYGSVQDAIFAREEAERLADAAHEKGIIELRKAQQADKLGDVDRKIAFEDKANDMFKARDQLRVQAAQVAMTGESQRFSQESQTARTAADISAANARNAADIAQRDRALQANLTIEREKIKGLREDRANQTQYNQLNAALGRYNQAFETYRKVVDDNKTGLMLPEDSKDPGVVAARKKAVDAVNQAWLTLVVPAKSTYDSIAKDVLKGYATTPQPAGGANPADPLNIRGPK